jgi:DNA-binding NarL/FixJ family response regulator
MQSEHTKGDDRAQALIVDDQPSTLMLVHAILDRAGYRVDECATGRAAIDALSIRHYDLVVLDLHLPDISGLDLLRDRNLQKLPPILGITSCVTADVVEQAEAAGMRRILEKPISSAQLIANAAAAIRDSKSTGIALCGGPVIDPDVLSDIKASNGDVLFLRFLDQALTDAWNCVDSLDRTSADDLDEWREHAQALDGVARSVGARRLTGSIDEALLMPAAQLHDSVGALIRQFVDLLDEAQEVLGEWRRGTHGAVAEMEVDGRENAQRHVELSEREREVLLWTAAGKTSSETAAILGISGRTVAFHITNILLKLDAVNKTQAVAKAVMLDLLH